MSLVGNCRLSSATGMSEKSTGEAMASPRQGSGLLELFDDSARA